MEFRETIRRRRMVRNYRPSPVPEPALERIVAAGLSAPSAGFSQGQSFVVVTDATVRSRIAELADEGAHVARGFDPWLSVAPAHIVVCVSRERYVRRYRQADKTSSTAPSDDWLVPYWWVDAGASLMAILLAAVDEGLAAGFLGAHATPGLASELGLPDDVAPIGIVTVGTPAPDRRSASLDRGRRPRTEVVHRDRWAGSAPGSE